MARPTTEPDALWRAIEQAGGIPAYVNAQLAERGFLVARREAGDLSGRDLEAYKQSLRVEAEERRKIAREAWRAYRENHVVHLGEGIYWDESGAPDKWDHPRAEERAAENELPPLDSPRQLAEALGLSVAGLRWLAYHRDAATLVHYRRFAIAKRDGSERAIWAPLPKLKAAQHWILRNIAEKLVVHGAVHGFLAGRSTLSNAEAHVGSSIVVKMDIKDFFPTITYRRVRGVFRKAGYRERVATLLALLCTESPREVVTFEGRTYYVALGPRCLPQGAPTSPALTNTLCLRMDQRLDGLARRLGWRYTRYADDLTLSLPAGHSDRPGLGTLLGLVRRIVEDEGFALHPEKTRVARAGARQKVTGLIVNGESPPRVPREFRRRLRAAIHNAGLGKPPRDGETTATLAGCAAYVHMTDPELGKAFLEGIAAASGAGGSPDVAGR